MDKITINDIKNNLAGFQEGLDCEGKAEILKEFILTKEICQKQSIKPKSKLLFAYLGTDQHDSDTHHYLIWLENEGGMLRDINLGPDSNYLADQKISLGNDGTIGYGQSGRNPIKMEVTYENGWAQARVIKTGKIIEFGNLPPKEKFEKTFTFTRHASFNIDYLLFGHPNIIVSMPEDMEHCLSFMRWNGNNLECLDDSFWIDMDQHGAELRKTIIGAGDVSPNELGRIIRQFLREHQ